VLLRVTPVTAVVVVDDPLMTLPLPSVKTTLLKTAVAEAEVLPEFTTNPTLRASANVLENVPVVAVPHVVPPSREYEVLNVLPERVSLRYTFVPETEGELMLVFVKFPLLMRYPE
jgi:hypothetical protein